MAASACWLLDSAEMLAVNSAASATAEATAESLRVLVSTSLS
ncbi:MAG: hypothetical protein E6898_01400 [Corynebacterium sp.]|nr:MULTISPECIES: hypothetical protein [unclassified Corynebacterium]MDU1461382.1 hypothetical protein [Corynebacterium sp.]